MWLKNYNDKYYLCKKLKNVYIYILFIVTHCNLVIMSCNIPQIWKSVIENGKIQNKKFILILALIHGTSVIDAYIKIMNDAYYSLLNIANAIGMNVRAKVQKISYKRWPLHGIIVFNDSFNEIHEYLFTGMFNKQLFPSNLKINNYRFTNFDIKTITVNIDDGIFKWQIGINNK
jgi:hypothetical protein